MNDKYILHGHEAVLEPDPVKWGEWLETHIAERIVKQEMVGNVKVSTVFLGLDYSFGDGPPLLFETMIFGGEHNHYQERYSTWDQAEAGHAFAVSMVQGSILDQDQDIAIEINSLTNLFNHNPKGESNEPENRRSE